MRKLRFKLGKYLLLSSIFPLAISCNNGSNPVVETISLKSLSLSGNYQTEFNVGDIFNYDGLIVTANYTDGSYKVVSDYTITTPNMNTPGEKGVGVAYSENNITKTAIYMITIVGEAINLSSISLSGSYQTTFNVNDTFNYSGLVVSAHYSNGSSKNVTDYSVSNPDMTKSGNKTVIVSYSEKNITKTANYTITVNEITPPVVVKTLSSISISGNYPTSFNVNDVFSYTGLVVTANYSDGSNQTVTTYSVSSPDMTTSGNKAVTVSYTEKSVTKTATYSITVKELPAPKLDPRDEPLFCFQYDMNHIGDIQTVWESYRGSGVTVAVIDVGFYYQHEDFVNSNGESCILDTSGYITTKSGTTSIQKGLTYLGGDEDHGTFCAGVVGARINGKGVAGIAPECNLMLLKTDAKPASINYAFKYASDNGAKVITISIGSYDDGTGDLDTGGAPLYNYFDDAVAYARNKGTVVISAGGNGGISEANRPTEYTYPAATTGVIGVGGLECNSSSTVWSGSSYNSSPQYQFCDVFAPAHLMTGMCSYNASKYDKDWKGTSFASPIVAGIAALYFEKYPNHTVSQFENQLYNSCLKIDDSGHYGYGAVDVARTLSMSTLDSNINIKIKANWQRMYAYQWNLRENLEKASWPGEQLNKNSDGYYTLTINPKTYDSVIFSNNGGSQSIDILTNLLNGRIYDLTSSDYVQVYSTYMVGHFLTE